MDRQAIQTMMQHVTHKLEPNQTLYPPKELPTSKKETIENSRSYHARTGQCDHSAPNRATCTLNTTLS